MKTDNNVYPSSAELCEKHKILTYHPSPWPMY